MQTGPESEEGNDELGGVAEARIEKTANPFSQARRQVFRGLAHPTGERDNGQTGGDKDPQGIGLKPPQSDGDRDKYQETIQRGQTDRALGFFHVMTDLNGHRLRYSVRIQAHDCKLGGLSRRPRAVLNRRGSSISPN